jgi:hypothetical protein
MAKSTAQRQAEWRDRQKAAKQAAQQAAETKQQTEPDLFGEADGPLPDDEVEPPRPDVAAVGTEVLRQLRRRDWALEAIAVCTSVAEARSLARRALGLAELPVTAPAPPELPARPFVAPVPLPPFRCERCGHDRAFVAWNKRHCVRCQAHVAPPGVLARPVAGVSA